MGASAVRRTAAPRVLSLSSDEMFGLRFQDLMILGIVAILLFGKNLPEMAKKFGDIFRS